MPVLVVVLGAVAVWALVLPTEPQLAAAESAFAGMLATGVRPRDRPHAALSARTTGGVGKAEAANERRLDSGRLLRTN